VIRTRPWTVNRLAGIKRLYHFDDAANSFTIETQFAVPIEANKRRYNDVDERARWGNGGVEVARLPMTILVQLMEQGMLEPTPEAQKKFRAWLNDPANRCFRVRPGRV
jgi:hypothetical protein